jgi:hypothetical protein
MQSISVSQKDYNVGWVLYMEGRSLRTCQNEYQRAGWWAALQAESDAETDAYLSMRVH